MKDFSLFGCTDGKNTRSGWVKQVIPKECLQEVFMMFLELCARLKEWCSFFREMTALVIWLRVAMPFQATLQESGRWPQALTLDHDHVDINGADGRLWKAFSFLQDGWDLTCRDSVVRLGPEGHQFPHSDSWADKAGKECYCFVSSRSAQHLIFGH